MRAKIKKEQIVKLNSILSTQNEAIHNLQLFNDEDQNESLTSRSHIIKDNYKYLQKISRAEEMVKQAKQIGQERAKIVKNGVLRKNMLAKETPISIKNVENEVIPKQKQVNNRTAEPHSISKAKVNSQGSSIADRRADEQISCIEEQKSNRNDTTQQVLPREIIEGEVSKSIVDVHYTLVKNYFKSKISGINASTSPQQIYRIMNPFYELCGVKILLPLIKKYKNCAYFGCSSESTYQGFLILHQEDKLYYGQLQNQKKNGRGTEIDFRNDMVYMGNYSKGRKSGVFTVVRPHEKYVGELLKGEYHGLGELTTDISVYKGYFQRGQRHGEGEEKFLQMGLTLCGTFLNNKFTNNSEKTAEHSRLNTINSKSQAHSHSTHKSNATARMNPENTIKHLIQDKNVVFERSAIAKQNYQEFDCEFGMEEEQSDDFQLIKTRKPAAFRIKDVKQQKPSLDRKRVTSQQRSKLYSILKQ